MRATPTSTAAGREDSAGTPVEKAGVVAEGVPVDVVGDTLGRLVDDVGACDGLFDGGEIKGGRDDVQSREVGADVGGEGGGNVTGEE